MKIIKKIFWGVSVGEFSVLGFTASLPAYACGPAPQTPCPVLTSINVTPVNHTIAVGVAQQFTATSTFSDGTSRALTSGGGAWVAKAPLSTARHGAAVAAIKQPRAKSTGY